MVRKIGNLIENQVYSTYLINIGSGKETCYSYCKKYSISKGQFYLQIKQLTEQGFLKITKGERKKKYYSVNFNKILKLFVEYVKNVKENRLYEIDSIVDDGLSKQYQKLRDFDPKTLYTKKIEDKIKIALKNYKFLKEYHGYKDPQTISVLFDELLIYLFENTTSDEYEIYAMIVFNPLRNYLFDYEIIQTSKNKKK
jgi:hypothetical protein